jgi:hypothetical protein
MSTFDATHILLKLNDLRYIGSLNCKQAAKLCAIAHWGCSREISGLDRSQIALNMQRQSEVFLLFGTSQASAKPHQSIHHFFSNRTADLGSKSVFAYGISTSLKLPPNCATSAAAPVNTHETDLYLRNSG